MNNELRNSINQAQIYAVAYTDAYVSKVCKGRATESDYYAILLLDQYLYVLCNYQKSISLNLHSSHHDCSCGCQDNSHHVVSCIDNQQAMSIIENIKTICGGSSCYC